MDFPKLVPTGRRFIPGDYPNTKYLAQDGAEFRVLYGDKRVGMRLELEFQNITDKQAEDFMEHYDEMKGTYTQFEFSEGSKYAKAGWGGDSFETLGAVSAGSKWRYESAPQLTSVYPGVSSVTVKLVAATI